MAIHMCPECSLVHDHGSPVVNPDVEIARITAETQLKIAQLQARADKHVAEVEAEADVDVAEHQAEGAVAAMVAMTGMGSEEEAEEMPEAEAAPVVVSTPIIDSGNDEEVPEPPKRDESESPVEEESKPKKKGLGLW